MRGHLLTLEKRMSRERICFFEKAFKNGIWGVGAIRFWLGAGVVGGGFCVCERRMSRERICLGVAFFVVFFWWRLKDEGG
jgi:hypothetical protein